MSFNFKVDGVDGGGAEASSQSITVHNNGVIIMGKIRRRRKTIRKYCRLSRSSSSSTISFPPQFGWLATAKEVIVLYSVAARGANKRWDVKLTRKNLTAIFNAAPPPKREKMISYFSIKWRGAPSSHHPAKRFNNHTRTGQERNAFKAARSTCRAIRVCSRWHDSDHY